MSAPKIRFAGEHDLVQLLALYTHLHEEDDPFPEEATLRSVWRRILTNEHMQIVVVSLNGELVSSCFVCVVPNLTRGCRPYSLIENVVTHSDHRRKGYGQLAMQRALEFSWSRNCYKSMLLTSKKDAGTQIFYESCGFVAGEKTGFIARPAD